MLYKAVILSGVLALGFSASDVSANALNDLDAAQRQVVVTEGPKEGGAIIMNEQTTVQVPVTDEAPVVPLDEAIAVDRATDEQATQTYDAIQQRLQGAVEAPVPGVEAAPVQEPGLIIQTDESVVVTP